ncbi:MAG: mechanosensitive ion channel [Desulfarculaceae bacterium]|nr:mechanosensitive ion channel [Desulfarculaceae bacterium]MCF8070777.1 mechanosensitive ion channel [Desulfarculaceae bacterium]MCF8102214.1 mechanosensitive ion channel [Desulfarculaceae bacterium]MCF8116987.1 mechanosensitive ion channel [Desulfarculaceae bacterium]
MRLKSLKWLLPLMATLLLAGPALGADKLGSPAIEPGKAPDSRIQQTLGAVFAQVPELSQIKAQARNGVVTLSGRTVSFSSNKKAVEVASKIAGVVYVVDHITVEAEVDSYLSPAWAKLRQVLEQALSFAPLVGIAALVVLGFYLAGRMVTAWELPYRRLAGKVLLQNLVRQLVRYAFVFTGLLLALEILGLTALIGAFMGAAGIVGLALGFAFKDIAENYVAGFLLGVRSPFAYQDWIAVGGHEGSVVRVTARELVIMTLQGNHVRIPNSQVFKSVVYNYTRNPLRRFDIELGVGVEEDLSRVREIGRAVIGAMKGVVDDPPPGMRNLEFADSAMMVRFHGWVDQSSADFTKVRSEAVRMLKEALDREGVDVPVPINKVINAAEAPFPPKPKAGSRQELMRDAGDADVAREPYLEEQIDQDRAQSGEKDLLDGK